MFGLLVKWSCCTFRPVALLADLVLEEPEHPLVPFLLEIFEDLDLVSLGDDCVVDGVIGDELEVSEAPVEGNSRGEVVHCSVLVAELSGIVGTDRD